MVSSPIKHRGETSSEDCECENHQDRRGSDRTILIIIVAPCLGLEVDAKNFGGLIKWSCQRHARKNANIGLTTHDGARGLQVVHPGGDGGNTADGVLSEVDGAETEDTIVESKSTIPNK